MRIGVVEIVLVPGWHDVLTKAYSAYAIYLAIATQLCWDWLSTMADSLPWWVMGIALVGALVGRIIDQKSVPS